MICFFFHGRHFAIHPFLHIKLPFSYSWIAVVWLRYFTVLHIDHNLWPSSSTYNISKATKMNQASYHLSASSFFFLFFFFDTSVVLQGNHITSRETVLVIYMLLSWMYMKEITSLINMLGNVILLTHFRVGADKCLKKDTFYFSCVFSSP